MLPEFLPIHHGPLLGDHCNHIRLTLLWKHCGYQNQKHVDITVARVCIFACEKCHDDLGNADIIVRHLTESGD